jgi:hypothetical protein
MWSKIAQTAQSVVSFLQTGKAPKGTPLPLQEEIKRMNHFASKKFFIAFTSFLALCFFYFASVVVLFLLPPDNRDLVSGYVQIFSKTIEVLAIIIAAYLGVQTIADFRYASSTSVNHDTVKSIEEIDQNIIIEETVKYQEIYKDDPSYAPIEWALKYDN